MNNSFEQLYEKNYPTKELPSKNANNQLNYFKKQHKINHTSKSKNPLNSSHSKYPQDFYQHSVMSNGSVQKNLYKANTSKSNHKRSSKRQDTTSKKNKQSALLKKCPTLQLTKKQKEIREAIEYRFQKSKMRTYKFCCTSSRYEQNEDLQARQIIDDEEQQKFAQLYGYLADFKLVNLYEYNRFKEEVIAPQKQKSNQKIIVIKNPKKKRQNSDTIISFNNSKDEEYKWSKNINTKLILNPNNSHYFSNNPVQSQRNHTDASTSYHHRNKTESPGQNMKLQFPSSKAFNKQKSGSRSKIKTQNSVGLNEKIMNSSSVQKNFKSIKDIYLNAISNLANKNTVKSNNKLFKSEHEMKNKGSRSLLYQSQKKGHKNEYHSTRPDKNNNSSTALHQNYFSCISSRQNKKDQKGMGSYNRKGTKQKLDKTLLINEVNSSQWKSVIMKVDDAFKSQPKETNNETANDYKKFKLKLKDHGFDKVTKSGFNTAHGKFMAHPHSYRQNTKSPKFKRYVINEDDQRDLNRKTQNPKNVSSVKNLSNQTYNNLLNQSAVSMQQQMTHNKKTRK